MKLTSKEQNILLTYQNWLQKNELDNKCVAYFFETNSTLIFLNWSLQYESIWIKVAANKWEYKPTNPEDILNKYFLLNEIIEIEKDFILKTFTEKSNL